MEKIENIQSPEKPVFERLINKEILNFKTGETYHLTGGVEMSFSDEDITRIASICSQEEVYNVLFKRMLDGKPYTEQKAKSFISWLQNGWETNQLFVFIIRNKLNEIVGAMDIKSANLDGAEVGYWADKNSSGFVTNALNELVLIAKQAGFKKLVADVRLGNDKSGNVLERSGFNKVGEKQIEDREYAVFERNI